MPRDNNGRKPKVITKHEEITKQRLRQVRIDNHYTQEQIAEKFGVSNVSISNFEKCDRELNQSPPIPIDYYLFISKEFNVSIDWIMGNDIETEIATNQKEKFETYDEILHFFKLLYNTFGNDLHIDPVKLNTDTDDFSRSFSLEHTLSESYKERLVLQPFIPKSFTWHTINHISIDNRIINNFLSDFRRNNELIDYMNDDNDFKKIQTDMFFDYENKQLKDEKIETERVTG